MKVLVADGDEVIQSPLEITLVALGHRAVTIAQGGGEALAVYGE